MEVLDRRAIEKAPKVVGERGSLRRLEIVEPGVALEKPCEEFDDVREPKHLLSPDRVSFEGRARPRPEPAPGLLFDLGSNNREWMRDSSGGTRRKNPQLPNRLKTPTRELSLLNRARCDRAAGYGVGGRRLHSLEYRPSHTSLGLQQQRIRHSPQVPVANRHNQCTRVRPKSGREHI